MKHTCPVCGTEDAIETTSYGEMQGDIPMSGWVSWAEITAQTCSCELSDAQEEAICESDTGDDEPDGYDDHEDDYFED